MNDAEFIAAFEAGTLPPEMFHHKDHVKAVWLYLRRYPALEALSRFTDALKRFAAAHGKANLYHVTITWAYVLLIHQRMRLMGDPEWEEFSRANTDLFDWSNNILQTYYCAETLQSDFARQVFTFPDKISIRK